MRPQCLKVRKLGETFGSLELGTLGNKECVPRGGHNAFFYFKKYDGF